MKFQYLLCLLFLSVVAAKQQHIQDYDYADIDENDPGNPIEEESAAKTQGELPVFEEISQEIIVKEGEMVRMNCKARRPTSHMLIFQQGAKLFYVGEMKVDKTSKIIQNEVGVFEIPNVQRKDAGNYDCTYQTVPPVKITYHVNVQYPPTVFSKMPKTQIVEKGSSVTVKCQAKGNPEPVISWSKDSGKLPSGSETEVGLSMTLDDVDRHVEGTYICTADNGIGEPASTAMKINVQYGPEIFTEKAIVHTSEGDIVELVCLVHARPAATVSWFKNGVPLKPNPEIEKKDGAHRHVLTISSVKKDKFGTYNCNAKNSMGDAFSDIILSDVPREPEFTSKAMSSMDTKFVLGWQTESFYPIIEYTVKYRLLKANESTDIPGEWHEVSSAVTSANAASSKGLMRSMKHVLKDLLPSTEYEATVIVKNKIKISKEASTTFSTRKERTGHRMIAGGSLNRACAGVLLVSLILSLIS